MSEQIFLFMKLGNPTGQRCGNAFRENRNICIEHFVGSHLIICLLLADTIPRLTVVFASFATGAHNIDS